MLKMRRASVFLCFLFFSCNLAANSIHELLNDYRENQARFYQKHRGNTFTARGVVEGVRGDPLGTGLVFWAYIKVSGITAYCTTFDRSTVSNLTKGQFVEFSGIVFDVVFSQLSLESCVFREAIFGKKEYSRPSKSISGRSYDNRFERLDKIDVEHELMRIQEEQPGKSEQNEVSADPSEKNALPSFNCNFAKSRAELIICNDPELARKDRDLAALYKKALGSSSDPAALRRATVIAWHEREKNCMDSACINEWYKSRTEFYIKQINAGR
jgi:hypothetical protein